MTLDDKVDQLLVDMAVVKKTVADMPSLTDRVRALEAWQWRIVGAGGLVTLVLLPTAALVLR